MNKYSHLPVFFGFEKLYDSKYFPLYYVCRSESALSNPPIGKMCRANLSWKMLLGSSSPIDYAMKSDRHSRPCVSSSALMWLAAKTYLS